MNRRRKQEKSISGWNIPEREGNLGRHWTEQLVSKRHITYLTASHVTYGRYPINTQNVGLFKPAKFSPFKNYFHVSFLLIFTIVPRCCCKKHLFQSTQLLCDEGRIQINISWLFLSLLGRPYSPLSSISSHHLLFWSSPSCVETLKISEDNTRMN